MKLEVRVQEEIQTDSTEMRMHNSLEKWWHPETMIMKPDHRRSVIGRLSDPWLQGRHAPSFQATAMTALVRHLKAVKYDSGVIFVQYAQGTHSNPDIIYYNETS